jgi:hypothetical protein
MSTIHLYIGWTIVVAFLVIALYGLVARVMRRREVGRVFWGLQYYTETVLVIQVVVGVVLLLMGRRVGSGFDMHYMYGAVFPLITVIVGRIYTIRREKEDRSYAYAPVALAGFIAFGLTLQALGTGLGWR